MNKLPGTGDFLPPDEREPSPEASEMQTTNTLYLTRMELLINDFATGITAGEKALQGLSFADGKHFAAYCQDMLSDLKALEKENEDLI